MVVALAAVVMVRAVAAVARTVAQGLGTVVTLEAAKVEEEGIVGSHWAPLVVAEATVGMAVAVWVVAAEVVVVAMAQEVVVASVAEMDICSCAHGSKHGGQKGETT